jgi:hypothetical protein
VRKGLKGRLYPVRSFAYGKSPEVNPQSGFTTGTPAKPGFLRSKKCAQLFAVTGGSHSLVGNEELPPWQVGAQLFTEVLTGLLNSVIIGSAVQESVARSRKKGTASKIYG